MKVSLTIYKDSFNTQPTANLIIRDRGDYVSLEVEGTEREVYVDLKELAGVLNMFTKEKQIETND